MPFVPSYNPLKHKPLIDYPTNQELQQLYGGGDLVSPPITQDTIVPNATQFVEEQQETQEQTTPQPQVQNSPMQRRQGEQDSGRDSIEQSERDFEQRGGIQRTDPLSQTDKYTLAAIGQIPGASVATGFTQIMDMLGVQGFRTPPRMMPGSEMFDEYTRQKSRVPNDRNRERTVREDLGSTATPSNASATARGAYAREAYGSDGGGGFGNTDRADRDEVRGGRGHPGSTDRARSRDRDEGGGGQGNDRDGGGSGDGSSGGVGCFVGDTPIMMADGSSKPISEVRVGDEVMSFLEDGVLVPANVVATKSLINWTSTLVDGTICTLDHRFLTPEGTFEAVALIDQGVRWDMTRASLAKKHVNLVPNTVYNIEVLDAHTYIANGWRVHNWK